ncbi:lactate/malate family dehydrogenase [Sulfurospirillum multivorans]|uniref:L-lactate dehydrogenase n=2 Tax=Sulfurospirillum multivorans TaxID=66821 RepID=A0AA86AK29_SULMK|nr:malate dehydrogenase [Sulfurospirillum multivorans]AHJ11719.1 L-lactate dehydrogenase [Sulfurospirillum multivorans DSM 12446]QEH05225.1 L-lactate dehydrogenase [Sulfurospirillum multivorans]
MRVGIIGVGGVGVELVNYLLTLGSMSEIVLVNRNKEKAMGEVADFSYVESFTYARNTHLHSGDYVDCAHCDVIVITAGITLKGEQTRDALLGENAALIRTLMHELYAYAPHAIIIMVTNPVDVLTHIAFKEGLYPRERLISAGTLVDTARFMKIVSKKVGIDPKNINGYVLGEHGKGSTLPWSICNICGLDVDTFCELNGLPLLDRAQIYQDVINAGFEIFYKKGNTNHSTAASVFRIIRAIANDEHSVLPLGVYLEGEYGLSDVVLNVPVVVTRKGATKILNYKLLPEELEALHVSAKTMQKMAQEVLTNSSLSVAPHS